MRRIFPGTSAVVAVGLLAAAAGCSGTTSTIGHAAWVKAVDAVCTRADAQAQRTTSAAAFGQVRTGEARALAALHPARVADVSAQREISDQMRTSGKIDALAHPTSADRVQAVDAEAGFTFGSLAAKLTPCAVDPALASGSSQSARDSLAAAVGDRWMCNNGDTLTDGERHQVVLVTDRFIHEEASDPRGPVKYQPWIQRGHPWGSLWFSLTDDYAVLTDSCPVTLSEVSLEAAMRSVLDRQPVPVQGNTPPERFLRCLNQTRQANVDFFAADQIIEGTSEPGSGTYLRPRQYAALRRSLTNDVRRMAELTPPAPMRAGQMALEHTMTLTLKFEQEFIESLDPNTNVRGVVMQAILTRAENARNVWLVSVQRLDDAYDVVPPAWAGPTPAQAASS